MKYGHVLQAIRETPWAIHPAKLVEILDLVTMKAVGVNLSAEEIESRIGAAAQKPTARSAGSVAVIPIYGVIAQRMDMFMEISGGTSTERLVKSIRAAAGDSNIKAIVLDIDSPGGSVYGIEEAGDEIRAAREQKFIAAVANSWAASAAYWLASQATEVNVAPGGQVGSVGVIATHLDQSGYLESAGLKYTLVTSGEYKSEGNPYEPLSSDAKDHLQAMTDAYYERFITAVAKGRGVKASDVRTRFGRGRMVLDAEAVELGMADRVATMDDVLKRLGVGISSAGPASAIDKEKERRRLDLLNSL